MHYLVAIILVISLIMVAKSLQCPCGCGCFTLKPCVKVNGVCCCASCVPGDNEQMRVNANREVTLYSADYCPHCINMKPIWAQVKLATANTGIIYKEVDQAITKTPGINGIPTIRMIDERGHAREYAGGPNFEQLRNWVVSVN